jgi:hypothetical protein
MFADDSKMQVSQEPGGMIRMVETDVSTDFLNVKIRHLSFDSYVRGDDVFNGPNMALHVILSTPEVMAFKRAQNIGPFSDGFRMPGDSGSNKPRVRGELDDVTVSQALDYVLQSSPGFWIYGNCLSEGGSRSVFIWFFDEPPGEKGAQ